MSINNFDVLKLMSKRNLDIRFGPDILRVQKTKAGTQVTVGIGGDVVAALAAGRLTGGLLLWDKQQYEQSKTELEQPSYSALSELLEAARAAQCACFIKERESGHLVDCWMPDLVAAIASAEREAK